MEKMKLESEDMQRIALLNNARETIIKIALGTISAWMGFFVANLATNIFIGVGVFIVSWMTIYLMLAIVFGKVYITIVDFMESSNRKNGA